MTLLQVKDLSVTLITAQGPQEVISNINFSMDAGDKLGIVGESGCGKSISALAMMSLLPPDSQTSGKIILEDQDILSLNSTQICSIRGNRIGMIFQEPMTALNPVKKIGAQVSESIDLHMNLNRKQTLERVTELMDKVGLAVSRFPLNLYPHQLSGGQRQRVMIAMAIACNPKILIADEPTTALDVTVQEQILDLIRDLADSSGMALIMISHDLGVIAQTTQNVMVMYTGNIVEMGRTVDVFQNMLHPYTYGLFSAIPHAGSSAQKKRKRLSCIPGQVPELHLRPQGCNFADRCSKVSHKCKAIEPAATKISDQHQVWCYHPLTQEDKK
ncbi:MAG: ABC transporter ATP-binding protein [Desulfobacteraceae bacterium]|nr:ABC transporter ATP-binding protein [Desulfobacteraceae bacterium]